MNVAVKSGYYFEIFEKDRIPKTLEKTKDIVNLKGENYVLYQATNLEDERKIDEMFGDRMGYSIDAHRGESKPKPKCALIGKDGNIFNLMGIASRTLKRNNMSKLADEMCNKITTEAKNYAEALCILSDYVEVTDERGLEDEEDEEY